MNGPKLHFRYAPALDRYCRLLSESVWKEKYLQVLGDVPYPTEDFLRSLSSEREKIWAAKGQQIISGLVDMLGLQFAELEIPVYAVGFGRAHSDPLVVPSNFNEFELVNVATHELIHRLLSFNTQGFNEDVSSPKLFSDKPSSVAVHVVVHALLQFVYLDILQEPQRLDLDKEKSSGEYKEAWDIVDAEGYKQIIEKVKASY